MKKARKKFEPKDIKNTGSRTKSSGLFHRYFYVTVLILFISFAILGSSLLIFIARNQSEEKTALLKQNAQNVAQTAAALIQKGYPLERGNKDATMLMSVSTAQLSRAIDADIYICDTDGKIICCKDIWQSDLVMYMGECIVHSKYTVPRAALDKLNGGGYTETGTLGGMYKSSHFISVEPIIASGQFCGAVVAAQDTDSLHEPVRAVLKMFLFSALLALAIAFVATYVLTYQMTKPLREMSAAAKQYAKGDFSNRISVPYHKVLGGDEDEVAELVTAFNSMANALSAIETSRRNFVANVSHELKTPMTTIGGFIDGILDGTIDSSKSSYYLRIVSDEVKRLSRLVRTMLNLSRIDNGELKLRPNDFDISETVLSTVLTFEKSIDEKKIDIRGLDTLQPMQVHGDEDLLHQIVYNLVENAVKFTNTEGYISFNVSDSIDRIVVTIENSGSGIQSDELPLVFEKFYKTDKSRSQDKNGMGLGLYLVRTIIKLHGGDISVSSVVNEYTRFSFYIPKPQEPPKLKYNTGSIPVTVPVEDAVISERPKKEHHGHKDNKEPDQK